MNWKFFVQLAIGFLESAGMAKKAEDDNDTGVDDLVGDALVFASRVAKLALSGGQGTKPTIPDSLK